MAGVPQPQRRPTAALTFGLFIVVTALAFENMAVQTAMPAAAAELGQVQLYAWVFTLFVIAMLFATVAAGRWCDARGPVTSAWVGFGVFAAGLVLGGSAPSMGVLLAARFVQGLGAGILNLTATVLAARAYDERERATLMTWFSAAWMLPAFAGPPLSAAIAQYWNWRFVFWTVLPVTLLAAALCAAPLIRLARSAHGGGHAEANPVPIWAAAAVALGTAALQLAGQRLEWTSLAIAAAGVLGLGFGLPKLLPAGLPRTLLPAPGLASLIAVRALTAGAFFGAEVFVPLMLVQLRGWTLFWAGAALTVGSAGWMGGAWLQSRPWLGWRRDRIIVAGAACVGGGVAAVAVVTWLPTPWLVLAVTGWVVCGFGMGLLVASTTLATLQLSPAPQQGRNTAAIQLADALGTAVAGGVAGTIFAALHSRTEGAATFGWVLVTMAITGTLSALLAARIGSIRNYSADPA